MSNPVLGDIELCEWVAMELPIRFIGDGTLSAACSPFSDDEFGGSEMESLAVQLLETLAASALRLGWGAAWLQTKLA